MCKFLLNLAGWICLVVMILFFTVCIFSAKARNPESAVEKSTYWKDVFHEEGYTKEQVDGFEEILADLGIHDLTVAFFSGDSKPRYAVCRAFGDEGETVLIDFREGRMDAVMFRGCEIYTADDGRIGTVYWEDRILEMPDGLRLKL